MLRVAALSTYENKPISTGVMLLEGDEDPVAHYPRAERDWPHYTGAMTSIKSFFRLADGVRTVFLVARDGRLLDIVDMNRWAGQLNCRTDLIAPCARAYIAHACATMGSRNVCIVLSPGREIKVFAGGAQVFTFRNADWHLLDLQAKYRIWEAAVGQPALARKLFQTALDLADVREGALFVVLRRPLESIAELVAPGDRLDMELLGEQSDPETPSRRHLLHVLAGPHGDRSRSEPARRPCHARWRRGDRSNRATACGRCYPSSPTCNASWDGEGHQRRRTDDGCDRGEPLRSCVEGQRRRHDHLLRRRPRVGHLKTVDGRQSNRSTVDRRPSTVDQQRRT